MRFGDTIGLEEDERAFGRHDQWSL
jgi:hypothetical protein